jgi:hypothetical protein
MAQLNINFTRDSPHNREKLLRLRALPRNRRPCAAGDPHHLSLRHHVVGALLAGRYGAIMKRRAGP